MKGFKGIVGLAMWLLVAVCLLLPVAEAASRQTVRVGYFNIAGYYTTDEKGQLHGYDVDYLSEISHCTNLDFEYVDCGTWLKAVELLKEGKIDLVGLSLWSQEREQQYEFCLSGYGYNISEVVAMPDNPAGYQDYEAIGKMKIGIRFNYVPVLTLKSRLAEKGQYPTFVSYTTQEELNSALANGQVDAIAASSHLVPQNLKVLDKFEYKPFYFIARKGNSQLTDKIDTALAEINIDNPDFDDEMLKKHFPSLNRYPLSKAEQEYISSIDSITFAFCTNEGYLCRTENGQYVGIHPAIARKLCSILGVAYKETQFDYPKLVDHLSRIKEGEDPRKVLIAEVKKAGIDVWGDFFYDHNWATKMGVGLSNAYLDSSYYEIKAKGNSVDTDTAKIAAVKGLRFTYDILKRYKPEQIVWCDDFESCIKAVKEDRADLTVVNSYAAEYYLAMFQYGDLTAQLIPFNNKTALAVVDKDNKLLLSALNKAMLTLTPEEKQKLIQEETIKTPKQNMLKAYAYTHTTETILFITVIVASIFLLISMLYSIKKSKEQNEMLLKATNAKTEFLAKMSHDMRTPMNAIINLTNMVEEELGDEAAVRADLNKIKISNEFLLSLINDVLDVSRIEQGKMVLNRQLYNDEDFVSYMHATFDDLCAKKNLELTISKDVQGSTHVIVDRVRFNQLCFNLVSNSVKYTPEGGKIQLALRYQPIENNILPVDIYVIDNGIGMSEDFVQKAFGQFVQENRQYMAVEGAGLGLSIVQEIVKLMGGTIEIKSKLNQGTTIHVHVPMEVADQETLAQLTKEQQKPVVDIRLLAGKRVLVVEDHPINLQIVERLLKKQGMEVITAADGMEAVEVFKQQAATIDLLLMDIRMPRMNGLEATKAIRALPLPKAKTIPILAMTANAYQEDVEASLAAGMNGHLAKPLVPKVLFETIAQALSR